MNLIISPHLDDEVYGCFSFLKGSFVFYVGADESRIEGRPDHDIRMRETNAVSEHCGFEFSVGKHFVNHYGESLTGIISDIERMITEKRPDTILIPYPSTNQDHQSVHKACMVALRQHDKIPFVKRVLIYEDPQQFLLMPMECDYFKRVDTVAKRKAYNLYRTQIRSYRSFAILKAMSELRGYQSNLDYAEGFKILRWVE